MFKATLKNSLLGIMLAVSGFVFQADAAVRFTDEIVSRGTHIATVHSSEYYRAFSSDDIYIGSSKFRSALVSPYNYIGSTYNYRINWMRKRPEFTSAESSYEFLYTAKFDLKGGEITYHQTEIAPSAVIGRVGVNIGYLTPYSIIHFDNYCCFTTFDVSATSGFNVDRYFHVNSLAGIDTGFKAIFGWTETVEHTYESTEESLEEASSWIDNLTRVYDEIDNFGLINTLTNKVIKDSQNSENKSKLIHIPKRIPAIGVRGSIDFAGTQVNTASPGWVTYEVLLPELEEDFFVPFSFGDNKDEATLDVFLNDTLMASLLGSDYETDVLNTLELDITGLGGTTAEIQFLLNTTGIESANIFIPDELVLSSSLVTAVPEPQTYAMFLAGLGLIGFAAREKKA